MNTSRIISIILSSMLNNSIYMELGGITVGGSTFEEKDYEMVINNRIFFLNKEDILLLILSNKWEYKSEVPYDEGREVFPFHKPEDSALFFSVC